MICNSCEKDLDIDQFPVRNDRSGRLRPYCYSCANESQRARYLKYKRTQPFKLKNVRTKIKAKRDNVPFDLTPEYLESIWTGVCPVLDTPIKIDGEKGSDDLAELDRFIPDKGYVQGNVTFLSRRVNRLKSDITIEEVRKLASWMERKSNE